MLNDTSHIVPLTKIAAVLHMVFVPTIFDDIIIGIGFLACLAATLYLYVTSQAVPTELYGLTGIFIGYYVRNMVAASKSPASDSTTTTTVTLVAPPAPINKVG